MDGTEPIDLDDFKQLVSAAMILAAAGLAGAPESDPSQEVWLEVPYSASHKPELVGGYPNINQPFCDIATILCNRFQVTHPRPRSVSAHRLHATVKLARSGAPSSHQVIAAIGALQGAFEGLGLHRTVINRLLLLRN